MLVFLCAYYYYYYYFFVIFFYFRILGDDIGVGVDSGGRIVGLKWVKCPDGELKIKVKKLIAKMSLFLQVMKKMKQKIQLNLTCV